MVFLLTANSRFFVEIKFSGESGELLYGKASDANEQFVCSIALQFEISLLRFHVQWLKFSRFRVAYGTALNAFYRKLMKSAFVLPSLHKFVTRRFQMNVGGEDFTMVTLVSCFGNQ